MRIHRLEISAFGPFAGTETIDFDQLSAHGLFLLNGPTGAGKTSVLDAICFALYGSVPGARQEGKRLRSDHAEPAAPPRVVCEFSARGRRFEVTRSPAWDKPSARGRNGFTTQQANTLLRERVAGEWVEKSGRNDEAGAEIADVLGMDREQFTRVVLLPQGDFAAFLRSKAADRLELLQKLFGTQRFEAVEQELTRKAAAARAEVGALNDQLAVLVTRAEAEAAPLELDMSAAPVKEDAPARLAWLEDSAGERAQDLKLLAASAQEECRKRAGVLEEETARFGRQLKLSAAQRRKAQADAGAPALKRNTDILARHRMAEVLSGQLQAMDAAQLAEDTAFAGMEQAAARLRAAARTDAELAGLDPDRIDVASELTRLRALGAVLAERLPDEKRLDGMLVRISGLEQQVRELGTEIGAADAVLATLHSEAAALLAGIRPLEELAGEAGLRVKEAEAADELVDVVLRYRSALDLRAGVEERHRQAKDTHQDLRQVWLDLREERLGNAAAELAARLEDGIPCPVCGSGEHPQPAPAAASGLSLAEAEKTAQKRSEQAEKALAVLEGELSAARQEVAVLAAQGGDTPFEQAREEAAVAQERAAAALQAAADLASSRIRQEELDDDIATTESAKREASASRAQAESTLVEVRQQAEALDAALKDLRNGHPGLQDRLSAVSTSAAVLERAASCQAELDQARFRAKVARDELDAALPAAGFETAAAARDMLLPAAEAARLQDSIRSAQDEAARIEELFASEDLQQALREQAGLVPVSEQHLAVLREEAASAEREARDAGVASGLAAKSVETLRRISVDYTALATAGRETREHAAMLADLAEAARGAGDNTYRMSLNSYVLAARLEQVAVAASERLVAMSDGRYTLRHTDAKAARGAKSGLGLEVVDEWTGRHRDTATLSGGESFMASLALALGLADVVQQEAGGVDIETLFVDEGFGSLDEQALEQVMDALEGLRDGGRVVGLVSHVGEMKQRIGMQLHVVKGRNGSVLRVSEDIPAA